MLQSENREITEELICKSHEILIKNSRGSDQESGRYRSVQNWLAAHDDDVVTESNETTKGNISITIKNASYIPPEPELVPKLMENLVEYMNQTDINPLIAVGIIHGQFETIHPFVDGNGRVGRILIPLYLLKRNVCGHNRIFISEELERNKYKYYALLNGLREDSPNWYDWLEFFITCIEKQANSYSKKADEVDLLIKKYYDSDVAKSAAGLKILHFCFQNPIFNSTSISKQVGLSVNTVNKWITYFIENKMLYPKPKFEGQKRGTTYYFYDLLDILR